MYQIVYKPIVIVLHMVLFHRGPSAKQWLFLKISSVTEPGYS